MNFPESLAFRKHLFLPVGFAGGSFCSNVYYFGMVKEAVDDGCGSWYVADQLCPIPQAAG